MRSANPRRSKPARAKITPAKSSVSIFPKRVCTLPRIDTGTKSGRQCKSCAVRRKLDVPTRAPAGKSRNRVPSAETNASSTAARCGIAPITRPCGSLVGISFKLCTAKSMLPSKSFASSASVNAPLPPNVCKACCSLRSPSVLTLVVVNVIPFAAGNASKSVITCRVCHSASALWRVPTWHSFRIVSFLRPRLRR